MLTTQEAATALGIDSGSRIGDLGQASAVLKYFGVEPPVGVGGVKTYDQTDVEEIAGLKATYAQSRA